MHTSNQAPHIESSKIFSCAGCNFYFQYCIDATRITTLLQLFPIIIDPYEVHHHIDNKNNIDEDIDDDSDDKNDQDDDDLKHATNT